MQQSKHRNIALDIMKGLGMLIVIKDHSDIIPMEYRHFTMSFMMPMFFLLAGYLYRPYEDNAEYIKKSFVRLYLPYLLGVLIWCIFLLAHQWTDYKSAGLMLIGCAGVPHYLCTYLSDWPCIGAFWFFAAMFWCRVIFNLIYTKCGKARYYVLFAAAIAGYILLRYVVHLPLGISEGMSVLNFFLVGHLFKYKSDITDDDRSKIANTNYDIPSIDRSSVTKEILLIGGLVCWVLAIKYSEIVVSAAYYKHFFIDFVGACVITYVFYLICNYIANHLPLLSRLLSWLGGGSLFILWIHRTELQFGTVNKILELVYSIPLINSWYVESGAIHYHPYIQLFAQYVFCSLCLLIVARIPPLKKFFGVI